MKISMPYRVDSRQWHKMTGDTMRSLPLLIFVMAWMAQAHSEQACVPVEKGWALEARAESGPLCADVLLQSPAKQEGDNEGTRRLRVFEAGKPGFESDEAALCKTCGGAMGDPFQGIEWQGQTLAVSNYGGSRESWKETWKIAKREGRWVIAGWDRKSIDRMTLDAWGESVDTLNGKATASFEPGAESKKKPRKLSCPHKSRTPGVDQIGALREKEPFACGLKVDWAN